MKCKSQVLSMFCMLRLCKIPESYRTWLHYEMRLQKLKWKDHQKGIGGRGTTMVLSPLPLPINFVEGYKMPKIVSSPNIKSLNIHFANIYEFTATLPLPRGADEVSFSSSLWKNKCPQALETFGNIENIHLSRNPMQTSFT